MEKNCWETLKDLGKRIQGCGMREVIEYGSQEGDWAVSDILQDLEETLKACRAAEDAEIAAMEAAEG